MDLTTVLAIFMICSLGLTVRVALKAEKRRLEDASPRVIAAKA